MQESMDPKYTSMTLLKVTAKEIEKTMDRVNVRRAEAGQERITSKEAYFIFLNEYYKQKEGI